jgi:hypothetical protein
LLLTHCADLAGFDVIISSYGTLAAEAREKIRKDKEAQQRAEEKAKSAATMQDGADVA